MFPEADVKIGHKFEMQRKKINIEENGKIKET